MEFTCHWQALAIMSRFLYDEIRNLTTVDGSPNYFKYRAAFLALVSIRCIYMLIARPLLPKIVLFDPLMTMANVLQFSQLFVSTFTIMVLFFAVLDCYYWLANKNTLTWRLLHDLIVNTTEQYLQQPDQPEAPEGSENRRDVFFLQIQNQSPFIRALTKIVDPNRILTNKMINYSISPKTKCQLFPQLNPVSKFMAMFVLNTVEAMHDSVRKGYGKSAYVESLS